MMLMWGLSLGYETTLHTQKEEEEEENKEQKRCWNKNTKIQIKLGKPTKGMRENN